MRILKTIPEKELFIKMVISAWDTQNKRATKLLETLTDAQLLAETAPGRNRGIYLIGHLAAVSDGMFPILGWGERLRPEFEKTFVKQPDKDDSDYPSLAEVREYWTTVNARVSEHISRMSEDEWFERHTLVSDEEFENEPHRNKLNILINRTNHHSYHLGQLIYLESKKKKD